MVSTRALLSIYFLTLFKCAYTLYLFSDIHNEAVPQRHVQCVSLMPGLDVFSELSVGGEVVTTNGLTSFNNILVSSANDKNGEVKLCIIQSAQHNRYRHNETAIARDDEGRESEEVAVMTHSSLMFTGPPSLFQVAAAASAYSVTINSLVDSQVNVSACSSSSGDCNFRSAVTFCTSTWNATSSDECTIEFPVGQTLSVNPVLGEISFSDVGGTLILEGNGCVVEMMTGTGVFSRLLNINVEVSGPTALHLNVQNMTASSFGKSGKTVERCI
jgi:hypothetical protein